MKGASYKGHVAYYHQSVTKTYAAMQVTELLFSSREETTDNPLSFQKATCFLYLFFFSLMTTVIKFA